MPKRKNQGDPEIFFTLIIPELSTQNHKVSTGLRTCEMSDILKVLPLDLFVDDITVVPM